MPPKDFKTRRRSQTSLRSTQRVDELSEETFDYVVTVCGDADEHCPTFSGATRVIHVPFDDPPRLATNAASDGEALAHYRRVRDEIRAFIEKLPSAYEE